MDRLPLYQRLIFSVPIFGWMLRDIIHGEGAMLPYVGLTVISLLGISTLTFGLAGLVVPVVLLIVPTTFIMLFFITRG
jgi:hypothetical protein